MSTESTALCELLNRFDHFDRVLSATTIPADGGSRRVAGIAHAVALSEATKALHCALGAAYFELVQQYSVPVNTDPAMLIELGITIPAEQISTSKLKIGHGGADPILLAAIKGAIDATAFPVEKWNAMQSSAPGAIHQQFHVGDAIIADDLGRLEATKKLLLIHGQRGIASQLSEPSTSRLSRQPGRSVAIGESTELTITETDRLVLNAMGRFDKSRLLTIPAIIEEMDRHDQMSERTVGGAVKKLIGRGLAERPEGERKGARLTKAGRAMLPSIAD